MHTPEQLDYIKQMLDAGKSKDEIRNALLGSGWQEADIEDGFRTLETAKIDVKIESPIKAVETVRLEVPKEDGHHATPGASLQELTSVLHTPSTYIPEKVGSKRFLRVLGGVALILALAGGGYAYYRSTQSPEKLVNQAYGNLSKVGNYQFSLSFEFAGMGVEGVTDQFTLNMDGAVRGDLNEPRFKGHVSFSSSGDVFPAAGFDILSTGKVAFLKFDNGVNLPFVDLTPIGGQWIKIDGDELAQKYLSPAEVEKLSTTTEGRLSREQVSQIRKSIRDSKFLKVSGKLPAEVIDGVSNNHYQYNIDSHELKLLFSEVSLIVQGRSIESSEMEAVNKFAEMFKSSQGEIWVNAKDRLPTRLTLLSYVNSSDYGQGNLSLDLRYRNFNMPVDFSEPADFRPLDEILQMIKGSLSDSSLLNNFLKPAN